MKTVQSTSTLATDTSHKEDGRCIVETKRVIGTFGKYMNLRIYPLDTQELTVVIISGLSIDEAEMIDEPMEIHRVHKRSFIDEQEFYIYKNVTAQFTTEEVDQDDENALVTVKVACMKVSCSAMRRPQFYVWNIFVALFLVGCLALLTFSIAPSGNEVSRCQLSFGMIMTTVTLKVVMMNQLPRIPYYTYGDKYFLIIIIFGVLVAFYQAGLTVTQSAIIPASVKNPPKSNRASYDLFGTIVFLVIYIVANAVFFAYIIKRPWKNFIDMTVKETEYASRLSKMRKRDQMLKHNASTPSEET